VTTVQEPGYVTDGQHPLPATAPIPPVFETAAAVRPPDRAACYGKMRTRKQYTRGPPVSPLVRERPAARTPHVRKHSREVQDQ